MWLRDPVPIEVSRVAVTPIGLAFIDDSTNQPFDLTGFSMVCSVAINDGGEVLAQHNVDITDATQGHIDVVFNGSEYMVGDKQNIAVLSYQIKAMDGSDQSIIAVRGPLILVPGI